VATSQLAKKWVAPYAICMNHDHVIFGTHATAPAPDAVLALARRFFPKAAMTIEEGEPGWNALHLRLNEQYHFSLYRFRRDEKDIRGELQAWAAAIEEQVEQPEQDVLLRQVATAQQIIEFWVESIQEDAQSFAFVLCQYLATTTAGVFHIDGRGYFNTQGELLLLAT
jgi:hypothetical protein